MYGSKPGNLRRLKTTASDPKRPFARHSRDHIPGEVALREPMRERYKGRNATRR